jgi:hypothetical protein
MSLLRECFTNARRECIWPDIGGLVFWNLVRCLILIGNMPDELYFLNVNQE